MATAARVTRILHPTDFSPSSERAFEYAELLREATDAELHLVHVIACRDELPLSEKELRRACQDGQHKLNALSNRAGGKKVVVAVCIGSTYGEIIRYVREAKVDLVVMGTAGMAADASVSVGSTAERVIRGLNVPVLTVKVARPHKALLRRCALCGEESGDVVCSGCKDRVRGEAASRRRM
jgi:nucleotide-binding universal stress UspA family protein